MAARALRTPLTMAVLSLLRERPRHPYDLQAALREREIGAVVRLRGGSLYDAIRRLETAGLLAPVETNRQGARPERTIYAITEPGRELLDSLIEEYVGGVAEEYPVFTAGLAHILNVDPDRAVDLLNQRLEAVRQQHDDIARQLRTARRAGMPRVVVLEVEYAQKLRRAELTWMRNLVQDIETGELSWLEAASPRAR